MKKRQKTRTIARNPRLNTIHSARASFHQRWFSQCEDRVRFLAIVSGIETESKPRGRPIGWQSGNDLTAGSDLRSSSVRRGAEPAGIGVCYRAPSPDPSKLITTSRSSKGTWVDAGNLNAVRRVRISLMVKWTDRSRILK